MFSELIDTIGSSALAVAGNAAILALIGLYLNFRFNKQIQVLKAESDLANQRALIQLKSAETNEAEAVQAMKAMLRASQRLRSFITRTVRNLDANAQDADEIREGLNNLADTIEDAHSAVLASCADDEEKTAHSCKQIGSEMRAILFDHLVEPKDVKPLTETDRAALQELSTRLRDSLDELKSWLLTR